LATIGNLSIRIGASTQFLGRDIRTAQGMLKDFGAKAEAAAPAAGLFGGLGKVAALAGGFGLVTAGIGSAVRTGMDFEKSMSRVKALTGASGAEFAALDKLAMKLGADTIFSAADAANAMSFFAAAGFKTKDILDAMGPTLSLAAAGQLDIAEAADITSKIMSSMKIPATELGDVADKLAVAFTNANTGGMQPLGEAMKFVGPVAKAAGKGLDETVAAIMVLSNAGIQGEMAGTGLRTMLMDMTRLTPAAAATMDNLGLTFQDTATGGLKPLAQILDEFNRKLAGMGAAQKLEVLGTIFEARSATAFAALLDASGDKLRAFETNLRNSAGAADRIASTMMDNTAGSYEQLKGSLETLSIQFFKTFGPELRSAIDATTEAVNASGAAMESNRPVISAWLGMQGGYLEFLSEMADKVTAAMGKLASGASQAGFFGRAGRAIGTGSLAEAMVVSEFMGRDFDDVMDAWYSELALSAISRSKGALSFLPGAVTREFSAVEEQLERNLLQFDRKVSEEFIPLRDKRLGLNVTGSASAGGTGGVIADQVRRGLGTAARWANDAIANFSGPGGIGGGFFGGAIVDFARSGLTSAARLAQDAIANATDMMAKSIRLELPAALEFGSREAFSAVARFQSGFLGQSDSRRTADNTKKTADNTDKIAEKLDVLIRQSGDEVTVVRF
jgi:TP901 family phage tail tape measure protein